MRTSRFASLSALSISTLFLAACTADRPSGGGRDDSRTEPAKASSHAVTVRNTSATVAVGFNKVPGLGAATLTSGLHAQLHAYALVDGNEITSYTEWSSSSPAILSVSNEPGQKGNVLAGQPGLATVHAQVLGETVDLTVLVTASSMRTLAIASTRTVIAPGRNMPLKAIATFEDDTQADVTAAVQWKSGAPENVPVVESADGVAVGGRGWGSSQVSASIGWLLGVRETFTTIEVVAGAADDDHDGYFDEDDCDDTDASRSPGAPEIPGNGKDDNCNGSVDEACTNGIVCTQVRTPYQVYSGYGRVSGYAEPNTVVAVRDVAAVPPKLTNINVDASGYFVKDGLPAQLAIVQNAKAGSAPSGKIWQWLGTRADVAPPPPAKDLAFEVVDGQTMNISGTVALHALAGVRNLSQQLWQSAQSISSGFDPRFRATLAASPGDWVDIRTSYVSSEAPGLVMRIPGADTRPPAAPTIGADGSDPYGPAIIGRSEARSTVTLRNTRSKLSYQVTAGDDGNYFYGGSQGIYPGDFVIAWANDGTSDGPKVSGRIAGIDWSRPAMVESLAVSPSVNGVAKVTGTVEIGAHAQVIYTVGGQALTVESTWNGIDDVATFEAQVPAVGGDTLQVLSIDTAGNRSEWAPIWVPASGDTPPAPRPRVSYSSGQWLMQGTAQPNSQLHVYNASSRTSLGATTVGDSLGNFGSVYALEHAQSGDVLLVWAEVDGHESARALVLTPYGWTANRAPLPVLDGLASESLDGITIVSGRSEINGTLEFAVGSDPVSSTADVLWSAGSSDTLGTFYAAVAAPPGATIRVTPLDGQGLRGTETIVTVPTTVSRMRIAPRE